MSAKGTELVDLAIQALEKITPDNGYQTDSGTRVVRGRAENLKLAAGDLPMISVSTTASTNNTAKPRAVRKLREIEVVGMVDASAQDYEPGMDQLDEDIALALAPLVGIDAMPGTMSVELGGGDYQHPEGGSNIAGVVHTITVSYSLTKPQ